MRHKPDQIRFIPMILTLIVLSYPLMLRAGDPPPTLSINDVSVTEGNSGQSIATFTVTLFPTSKSTVIVKYRTANHASSNPNLPSVSATGAAACDVTPRPDYLTTTGTLTFKTGIPTNTIQIPVCGDTAFEPNEIFDVNLTVATNAAIGDGKGLGVIMNNDSQINLPTLPTLSIAPLEVSGVGSLGSSTSFKLNVTLSVPNPSGASVVCAPAETNLPNTSPVLSASGGTSCTAGTDFILSGNRTVTFGPTETSKSCPVIICGDTVNEKDESFVVNLSNAQGAIIGIGSATVVIKD